MTTVAEALISLGVEGWTLRGEPTTEAEFHAMFRKIVGVDASNTAIESDQHDVVWSEVLARLGELAQAQPLNKLRAERDQRLAETDWWVLPDLTPTEAQLAYRQALRDITNTYTSLDDVVWPEKPE